MFLQNLLKWKDMSPPCLWLLKYSALPFSFPVRPKKQNQIIQMTYANSNHEPFNMCRFFTRPESDLCPALSVTDAADVVETLNDVTLCPKYYTISILADSAKHDLLKMLSHRHLIASFVTYRIVPPWSRARSTLDFSPKDLRMSKWS